jgi:tellurite resistance protein
MDKLIDKAGTDARRDDALHRLRERAGVADVATAERLRRLGFTDETVVLIRMMPLLAVAWADGHISDAEREAVISEARSYGIAPDSAADRQLAAWLTDAPSEIVREAAVDILAGSILGDAERVIAACHTVASASGGAFGLRKVSAREQDVLDRITYALARKGIVSGRFMRLRV